jgi:aspartate/methionine/tyrosine aminotransferase
MNSLPPFQTELYFAEFEFTMPHQLSCSDCQTLTIAELLALAGSGPEALLDVTLGYSPSWGDPALRDAIARTYATPEPDNVLVLSSPIEGLFLLSQVIEGETIVLLPAYDALKNLPRNIKPWSLRASEDGWRLDWEALESLAGPQTEMLVVNFPHNPTGFQPDLDEWFRLAEWAMQRGIRLFCDEMYRGLCRPDRPVLPSALDMEGNNIVLGGLSKAHGLPGLRCGWLATWDLKLLRRLHDLKLYTSICPASPVEALATVALQAQEALFARSRAQVDANVKLAENFFARWPQHFHWRAPRAGSVALVELLQEESAEAFCYRMAHGHGIVLLPGTFLGFPDRFVRIGLGRRDFPQALQALETVLSG